LILEIPDSVVLPDGTSAQVKGIAAKVIDGKLEQIVYTVEKASGAWSDVASEDVGGEGDRADVPTGGESRDHLEVQQV
jgi:hypothetical protein